MAAPGTRGCWPPTTGTTCGVPCPFCHEPAFPAENTGAAAGCACGRGRATLPGRGRRRRREGRLCDDTRRRVLWRSLVGDAFVACRRWGYIFFYHRLFVFLRDGRHLRLLCRFIA